jgi:hypothetical protein
MNGSKNFRSTMKISKKNKEILGVISGRSDQPSRIATQQSQTTMIAEIETLDKGSKWGGVHSRGSKSR